MEPVEIKAVDMVRQIRDRHSVMLQGKTFDEVIAFFHQEAIAANEEASLLFQALQRGSQVSPSIQADRISPREDVISTAA